MKAWGISVAISYIGLRPDHLCWKYRPSTSTMEFGQLGWLWGLNALIHGKALSPVFGVYLSEHSINMLLSSDLG